MNFNIKEGISKTQAQNLQENEGRTKEQIGDGTVD